MTAIPPFRFRPRMRALAIGVMLLGVALLALGAVAGSVALALIGGAGGGLGGAYLGSPAWKLVVIVDDEALEVRQRGVRRFRLAWGEIVRVVASRETSTCFVDGGSPRHSLLVPGPGAPASYEIERREALFAAILARVPAARVQDVPRLDAAGLQPAPPA